MCVRPVNYAMEQELRDRKGSGKGQLCNKLCLAGTLSLGIPPFKRLGLNLYKKADNTEMIAWLCYGGGGDGVSL